MADDEFTGRSSVVAALIGVSERERYVPPPVYSAEEIKAISAQLQAQSNSQNRVRDIIYAAVSKWARVPVEPGGPIPIVREGKVVEWRPQQLPFLDNIAPILRAARLMPASQLKAERAQLERLLKATELVRQSMETLDVAFRFRLDRTWSSNEPSRGEPVDIVHALGVQQALTISLHGTIQNIRQRLKEIEEELALQPSGRGRPPLRPAYEAAKELALLYTQVTGKRPTCSVSDSMVSGEFAPALRDVFDVFEWSDIRGPGNAAVEAITEEYLLTCQAPGKGIRGGLFGLRQ